MIATRWMLAPKLFYFCWFAAAAAFVPFSSLFFRASGLDLAQIGILSALPGLLMIVAAPIWGLVADALRIHRILLPLTIAGTLVPVLLISQASGFGSLIGLVIVQSLFTAPVVALADSATLALLGGDRERYGTQRFWGAVGWGVSTIAVGALIERVGLWAIFAGYAGMGLLTVLVALGLPHTTLPATDFRRALGLLARSASLGWLLACLLLIGYCNGAITGFLAIYLQDLGATSPQIGIALAVSSLSELPVMALSPLALRRFGARPMLIAAGVFFALRVTIYALAPAPGWALAAQLLHGLCFAATYTASVVEVQRLAPAGLEATSQSLFGMIFFGVAPALAGTIGGRIYQSSGATVFFGVCAVAALLGALGLAAGRFLRSPHSERFEGT
jgi:MFS transporter, PPP family, 3-phenylpropionic acid transporter